VVAQSSHYWLLNATARDGNPTSPVPEDESQMLFIATIPKLHEETVRFNSFYASATVLRVAVANARVLTIPIQKLSKIRGRPAAPTYILN